MGLRGVPLKQLLLALTVVVLGLAPSDPAGKDVPAFSGAEGYGANTPGGRGERVIFVANLNDSGSGSLRAACEAEGRVRR